jgi:hypothetical protein
MGERIIIIKVDKAKQARRTSRACFGRPGAGRKTRFTDQRREADRNACRRPVDEDA